MAAHFAYVEWTTWTLMPTPHWRVSLSYSCVSPSISSPQPRMSPSRLLANQLHHTLAWPPRRASVNWLAPIGHASMATEAITPRAPSSRLLAHGVMAQDVHQRISPRGAPAWCLQAPVSPSPFLSLSTLPLCSRTFTGFGHNSISSSFAESRIFNIYGVCRSRA